MILKRYALNHLMKLYVFMSLKSGEFNNKFVFKKDYSRRYQTDIKSHIAKISVYTIKTTRVVNLPLKF